MLGSLSMKRKAVPYSFDFYLTFQMTMGLLPRYLTTGYTGLEISQKSG
jgi:hypothetical protein